MWKSILLINMDKEFRSRCLIKENGKEPRENPGKGLPSKPFNLVLSSLVILELEKAVEIPRLSKLPERHINTVDPTNQ